MPATSATHGASGTQPPGPLDVEVRHERDRCVVTVTGGIDLPHVARLRRVLDELIVEGYVALVLDLSEVPFLDSSGLGALVGARRKAKAFKGSLVLVSQQERLVRLLRLTGLSKVFQCFDTVEEALEAEA